MATRDDIKAFLASDIPGRLASLLTLPASDSYVGQMERLNPADFEVRTTYEARTRIIRTAGLTRHSVSVEVLSIGWDESEEDGLADSVEDAAEALVDAYDGRVDIFAAGLTNVLVERARCWRTTPMTLERRRRRALTLSFELDEMEA